MSAISVCAVLICSRPSLPPTTMAGHTEELPGGYVLSTPMPEAIQRHMLEHADGKGRPGVIIQYNCDDFVCGVDLFDQLAAVVHRLGAYVSRAHGNHGGQTILRRQANKQTP